MGDDPTRSAQRPTAPPEPPPVWHFYVIQIAVVLGGITAFFTGLAGLVFWPITVAVFVGLALLGLFVARRLRRRLPPN